MRPRRDVISVVGKLSCLGRATLFTLEAQRTHIQQSLLCFSRQEITFQEVFVLKHYERRLKLDIMRLTALSDIAPIDIELDRISTWHFSRSKNLL